MRLLVDSTSKKKQRGDVGTVYTEGRLGNRILHQTVPFSGKLV